MKGIARRLFVVLAIATLVLSIGLFSSKHAHADSTQTTITVINTGCYIENFYVNYTDPDGNPQYAFSGDIVGSCESPGVTPSASVSIPFGSTNVSIDLRVDVFIYIFQTWDTISLPNADANHADYSFTTVGAVGGPWIYQQSGNFN